jgi:hypothetical protein
VSEIIDISLGGNNAFLAMFRLLSVLAQSLSSSVRTRAQLVVEIAALRQQLATYKVNGGRPRIRAADRLFWVLLRRFWSRWTQVLVIVRPKTLIRWHPPRAFGSTGRGSRTAGAEQGDRASQRRSASSFAGWRMKTVM